jgi:[CysO sulfur-carrier protein]-S-L-cysteine hydrolase
MFEISALAREGMFEHCLNDFPNEACGYLVGEAGIAIRAIKLENIHQSPSSYEMDPKEQMEVQKRLRTEGLEPLAIYHSHVATEAYPSRRDINQATAIQDFFAGHYVIVTLKGYGRPRARVFTVRDHHVQEEELHVVEDAG